MPNRKAVALTFMTSDISPAEVEKLVAFFRKAATFESTLPLKDGTEAQMLVNTHAAGAGETVTTLSRLLNDPAFGWVVALCAGAPADLQVPEEVA